MIRLALVLLLLAALASGCGEGGDAAASGRLNVVATTTQAADLAREVGGDRVAVTGLLAPNADPRNVELAVPAIRDAMTKADPAGAAAYRANAAAYLKRVRRLDARVRACIGRIPAPQRKLVTTHDALGYYAARYGLDV